MSVTTGPRSHPDAAEATGEGAARPPRLRISLLGPMAATGADGASVLPRVRKTRAVLAMLALAAPRAVTRDRLTGLLWSRRAREQARASLRQSVHELQSCLGPQADMLVADRNYLALRTEGLWCDATARPPDGPVPNPHAAADQEPLADLTGLDPAFDAWLAEERRRIATAGATLARALMDQQTDPAGIIAAAERLLAIDPTHHAAWRALMAAHAALGDRAGALRAYQRCGAALARAGAGAGAEAAGAAGDGDIGAILAGIRDAVPARPAAARARAEDRGPRLGVMPFRALDGVADDGLALGLAEEITNALSRFRWFFLVASPSLGALAEEPRTGSARWEGLNLDFLLDGSVRRGAARVRIMVRLLDMRAGGQVVWTQRFDRDHDDILTLQDEIAAATVAQLDPELLRHAARHASDHPPGNATAFTLMLRAIPALYRLDEASFRAAGALLAEAVALDPTHGAAHAWWAYWQVFLVGQGWAADPGAAMARAGELAERAIVLDPSDARGLTIAGHVRAFLHRRLAEAMELHDKALTLNPNLPLAWVFSGLAHAYAGQPDEGVRRIRQAQQLSPFDPHGPFFESALTVPLLQGGHYESVVELGRRTTSLNPGLSTGYKGYLSALGHLGRIEEQAVVRERLLRLEPGFTVTQALARSPLLRPADRLHYAEGLRRAGLPE